MEAIISISSSLFSTIAGVVMPDEETVAWLIDVISIDYCVKGLNRIKVYLR